MKIAQIAPLAESVPPKYYGGTERIVSYLTEELVSQGHDVTLFASGDSRTAAELVPITPAALRLTPGIVDPIPYHMMLLEAVRQRADEFDALHFHIDLLHLPMAQNFIGRTVTTLHGRLDLPDLPPFYRCFGDHCLVSISDHQRKPMPPVNWGGTIYHGLPADLLPPRHGDNESYLAFLGRISPEKRPDRAIRIAARAGKELRIAAKVDNVDRAYWETEIAPLIDRYPNIHFVGEINEQQKAEFLGNASALLFPIDWPEPFGLVMIEAMACGTPVIAFRCGSVPEVIEHGRSGFIVDTEDEAVAAIEQLSHLDRGRVRSAFDARFTAARMAADYTALYHGLPGARTDAAWLRRQRGEEAELQIVA
ncbi:glycosyltransferase family 4 protein [Sphingobium yanoikuyae]|uniref:glycosyltransferase family 4 protein n=1 Tax=Sphingobium yanoikuyae TaxID=13690 RepID=UPI0022DD3066|nr:glycosyltransferase family 4 protein [Sphingobium yanoikuyae]WBQ19268.1 glycosyltransferase family 4 protein [Sphingobium yanoikuyae]